MIKAIDILSTYFDSFFPSSGKGELRDNRVERMKNLLATLSNPERSFKAIHIAGSKGKGSTAFFISELLESEGHRTGLYLSPHVYDIRERFTESGEFFSASAYLNALDELDDKIKHFKNPVELGPEKPTTFELYTAYSYLLFKREGMEYGVIETGMGGRLDATNTLSPLFSIITTIEKEHTEVLGSTISAIAKEKAGIIKKNRPIFVGNTSDEAIEVFKERANELASPLTLFKDYYSFHELDGDIIKAKSNNEDIEIKLPLPSLKEGEDALLSYMALKKSNLIKSNKLDLSQRWLPGRYEKVSRFIFDGAHTKESAEALSTTIANNESLVDATLIFSAADGKDIKDMLLTLIPLFSHIIISKPEYKESKPEKIYELATSLFPEKDIILITDGKEAVKSATSHSGLILVTGSFYLVSKIRRALDEH